MTNGLKPCPFCHGNNVLLVDRKGWWAWCKDCSARTGAKISMAGAERAWNQRAEASHAAPEAAKTRASAWEDKERDLYGLRGDPWKTTP